MNHRNDPDAISWDELKDELGFTPAERAEITAESRELIAQARAYRPVETRP